MIVELFYGTIQPVLLSQPLLKFYFQQLVLYL